MHRRSRLAPLLALLVAPALVVAACSPTGPDPQAPFSGASLTIEARNLAFAPDIATAPANTPLRVVLDNQDAGVPHNVRVFQGDVEIGKSATVQGPGLVAVVLPALAPGRYQFACTVHPSMIGTIVVGVGASAGPSGPADSATDGPTAAPGPSSAGPAGP